MGYAYIAQFRYLFLAGFPDAVGELREVSLYYVPERVAAGIKELFSGFVAFGVTDVWSRTNSPPVS
jgi:hypothetical protein